MMGKEKTLKTQSNADKMKNWFAVYVRSRAEKKVAEALLQQGYEFFLPLKKTLRNWSDRKKWVDLPLIPGLAIGTLPELAASPLWADKVITF